MNQRHCQDSEGCRIDLLICNSDKCTNIPEYRAHIDDRENRCTLYRFNDENFIFFNSIFYPKNLNESVGLYRSKLTTTSVKNYLQIKQQTEHHFYFSINYELQSMS